MSTIRDIAIEANVSIATVSRAFKKNSRISTETRNKILQIASNNNYQPNSSKFTEANNSKLIGMIVSSADNPFYTKVIQTLEPHLIKMGYKVLYAYSNENPEQESEAFKTFLSLNVSSIVYTPTNSNSLLVSSAEKQGISVLQLYRTGFSAVNSIIINDEYGGYIATNYLLQNGHRRILMITLDTNILPLRDPGYIRAFKESTIDIPNDFILKLPFHNNQSSLICEKIKELKPTAIIAVSNTVALDTLLALKQLNLSVPNDISVVVYDDFPWMALLGITAVSHPVYEIADAISKSIDCLLNKNVTVPIHVTIDPFLITRNSVLLIKN